MLSQVDGPFNYWGYLLNILLPHGGVGVGKYHPEMKLEKNQWYCSQLIGVALQAMADDESLDHGPYVDEDETHIRRAASGCASVLFGTLIGIFFAYYIAFFEQMSRRNAILIGVGSGSVGFWAITAFIVAVAGGFDHRTKHIKKMKRETRGGADWRTRVAGRIDWQKSSPNDLYASLAKASGVVPSRDPSAAAMRV